MHEELEKELAALAPADPTPGLDHRVALVLAAGQSRLADRLLLSAIGAGLAAALVISTLLLTGAPPDPPRADVPFTIADTPRLLAQLEPASTTPPLLPAATTPSGVSQ